MISTLHIPQRGWWSHIFRNRMNNILIWFSTLMYSLVSFQLTPETCQFSILLIRHASTHTHTAHTHTYKRTYSRMWAIVSAVRKNTWRCDTGVVSLTFCELFKIMSRKYTMPEITFTVWISSWNFVVCPKRRLKFSWELRFLQYTHFERTSWRARETLVIQPQVLD